MKIEVRLFATFREYLPAGCDGFSFVKVLDRETTVGEVVEALKLPEQLPKIIIVNGIHAAPDYVLKDGDVLSLFPPIAGG
jgi:molybdopterin converting factor small subunit